MPSLQGFDADTVEPMNEFEPIPVGKYLAVITDSEFKPTKAGNGEYLQLTFEIIDGDYKGRLLWARLNLDNPNPAAVKIAKAELAAICKAVSVPRPNESSDLHNLPMLIDVRLKKRSDSDDLTNEIRGYAAHDAQAGKPVQAAPERSSLAPLG